jgi:phosphoglycolate phosphatase-like HAD superfamily hydrolase
MRLLLFDVDGTLLRANGGGETAIERAVSTVTGTTASTDGISFSGRTDPAIFRDVLRSNGLPTHDDLLGDVLRAYVETAQQTIRPENVDRLPGTETLLTLFACRTDTFLGLVTGNVEPIAFHKLQTAGLAEYFSVGAFGSDHENRSRLPSLAADRAAARTGRSFSLDRAIVIGDTSRDIDCARAAGARAVAVCTGRPDRSELASATPDLLLKNFANPDAIIDRILEA